MRQSASERPRYPTLVSGLACRPAHLKEVCPVASGGDVGGENVLCPDLGALLSRFTLTLEPNLKSARWEGVGST